MERICLLYDWEVEDYRNGIYPDCDHNHNHATPDEAVDILEMIPGACVVGWHKIGFTYGREKRLYRLIRREFEQPLDVKAVVESEASQ